MTFTKEQVESIVAEVIRRLGVLGVARGERSPTPAGVGGELTIAERVVTLRSVEGRLAGVSRLVVLPRAVVTPAVRDELKQRQIELVREAKQ
jgi:hypothetical protein